MVGIGGGNDFGGFVFLMSLVVLVICGQVTPIFYDTIPCMFLSERENDQADVGYLKNRGVQIVKKTFGGANLQFTEQVVDIPLVTEADSHKRETSGTSASTGSKSEGCVALAGSND